MSETTKLFTGMLIFCILMTMMIYLGFFEGVEVPRGFSIFRHPENVSSLRSSFPLLGTAGFHVNA